MRAGQQGTVVIIERENGFFVSLQHVTDVNSNLQQQQLRRRRCPCARPPPPPPRSSALTQSDSLTDTFNLICLSDSVSRTRIRFQIWARKTLLFSNLQRVNIYGHMSLGRGYVCIRVGHEAGPCTATFNDLLCFGQRLNNSWESL
jgi:hypothetical protein